MQKNGKQLNPVHKASGSSKQNKTARFFRELGKLAIEHPILTVSMIVTAASFTFGSGKTQAQTKDKAKTELALLTTGEKKDVENDRKVTYENGIKIVGEKTFDVEILNDSLYFPNSKLKNGHIGTAVINIEEILFEMELKNATVKDIKQIIYPELGEEGKKAYIVFEKGIIYILNRTDDLEAVLIKKHIPKDGSTFFVHEGAIFTKSDGTLVATTPNTLLVITPNDTWSPTYESLFGKIPPLKRPIISGGRTLDEVF
ncbi:TPA: hypothetical protein HA225_01205, partial [Candidatus Micrarchaeota archaeon]|nr:hypothetical protein [Candidatus Micrarchaeota archaeon]